jgi:hypothetical protein
MMGGNAVVHYCCSNHGRGRRKRWAAHQLFNESTIGIAEDDVGATVTIEVACSVNVVLKARVPDCRGSAEQRARTIQQPNGDITFVISKQDVVCTIAIEVAVPTT